MNPLNSTRRGASAVNTAQSGEPQKKSTANNIPLRTLSPTGTRPVPPRPARALTAPGLIRHQLQLAGIFRQRAALALTERDKRVRLVFALAVCSRFSSPRFFGSLVPRRRSPASVPARDPRPTSGKEGSAAATAAPGHRRWLAGTRRN